MPAVACRGSTLLQSFGATRRSIRRCSGLDTAMPDLYLARLTCDARRMALMERREGSANVSHGQMGKDSLHFDRACYNFERIFVYHPLTHLTYIVAVCAERRSELHLPRAWLFTAFVGARNPTHSGSGPVSRPSDSVRGRWGPTPLGAVSSARRLQPPLIENGAHSPSCTRAAHARPGPMCTY